MLVYMKNNYTSSASKRTDIDLKLNRISYFKQLDGFCFLLSGQLELSRPQALKTEADNEYPKAKFCGEH